MLHPGNEIGGPGFYEWDKWCFGMSLCIINQKYTFFNFQQARPGVQVEVQEFLKGRRRQKNEGSGHNRHFVSSSVSKLRDCGRLGRGGVGRCGGNRAAAFNGLNLKLFSHCSPEAATELEAHR